MARHSYKIATIMGIPIKVHISLIFVLLYILLASGVRTLSGMLFAIGLQLLIFASIALHELGHSFVAIRKGCRVREITLLFMGGAAQMERLPERPRDEILMALAGPAVSLTLGITGSLGGLAILQAGQKTGQFLFFAGVANLMLAGFNLLPAFPMDGGRVLRAALTPRMGRLKATFIASRIGRFLAGVMFTIGIFGIPGNAFFRPLSPALMAIGFFIFTIAGREYKMVQLEDMLNRQHMRWHSPFEPVNADDEVLISPPPYEHGQGKRTELKKDSLRFFDY